jgi:hypothetical protein
MGNGKGRGGCIGEKDEGEDGEQGEGNVRGDVE